ncbi:MAG: SGNH/GDSL hydrolase family protein [Phycisphaerales bacterium]|nr:SGNH/GDSL hydrolase family protein [Phycisphaerales bacterium]
MRAWLLPICRGMCVLYTAAGLGLLLGGCTPQELAAPAPEPVVIVGTEGLVQPAVRGFERVFRPMDLRSVTTATGTVLVAEFEMTVAKGDSPLRVRLVDPLAGTVRSLSAAPDPGAIPAAGAGFWPGGSGRGGQRIGVRLPAEWLGGRTRLELYTATDTGGAPLGLATLELAPEFFYLAVVGDSIQWGNGLHERDKISARVAATLERETGRRVVTQRYAHSGATILPRPDEGICTVNCNGEVPTAWTSVFSQVELIQSPEIVELVLLDGCINDVGLDVILDPTIPPEILKEITALACEEAMFLLLQRVQTRLPQAAIAVTGYYRIITEYSDLAALRTWEQALDGEVAPESDSQFLAALIRNSQLFDAAARAHLAAAVERVRADQPAARITFADPAFPADRAVFTPDRWLWSLQEDAIFSGRFDLGFRLVPEDPLRDLRGRRCVEPGVVSGAVFCMYASVGHPNPAGAARYAERVVTGLREIGVLAR